MLGLRDLSVKYGDYVALLPTTLHFSSGEFVAILGPNGAGKSTLLKALVGLIPTETEQVYVQQGHSAQQCISYVPQQQSLDWTFPVTVWDVVMMGRTGRLGWFRRPKSKDRDLVTAALKETGVYDLRQRHIKDLSGGQRQRVLLARMLVREGHVLLLDEPLTGVDLQTQDFLMSVLRAETNKGCAVVMVTHDVKQACQWCDRLILLNKRVIADGTPDEVYTSENVLNTFGAPVAPTA